MIALSMASVALLISLGAMTLQIRSKPLGEGIQKYSFAEPLEAYKSFLQMSVNKDILAQIQLNAALDLLPKIIAETLTKDWYDCLNHSTLANRSPSPAP